MAYGSVSTPWLVGKNRLTSAARTTEGATFVVAASDSNDTTRADYQCDGTADEVEINQALNALPSGGGYVQLLEGTYNISTGIVIPSDNISLVGNGGGTSIETTSTGIIMIYAAGRTRILIDSLRLRSVLNVGPNNRGIRFSSSTYSVISNCWIGNMRGQSIEIFDSSSNVIVENCFINNSISFTEAIYIRDSDKIEVTNAEINSNGSAIFFNIRLEESTDCKIIGCSCYDGGYGIGCLGGNNNVITGNVARDCVSDGIYVANSEGNTITGNTCSSNNNSGVQLFGSTNNTVLANICNSNVRHGIFLTGSSDNTITGNICVDNDSGDTGTYDGIIIDADSDNNIVSSNRCSGNDRDGVRIDDATCNKNLVLGNQLLGNTGAALTDNGTNTLIASNVTV